jgi:long-chain alkane monooxygenase
MADKRLHFGWFMNFTANEWNTPFGNDGNPWNGKFYIEMA